LVPAATSSTPAKQTLLRRLLALQALPLLAMSKLVRLAAEPRLTSPRLAEGLPLPLLQSLTLALALLGSHEVRKRSLLLVLLQPSPERSFKVIPLDLVWELESELSSNRHGGLLS
jgi:hypothetical protein